MPGEAKKSIRHALELRFGENDRRLGIHNVGVEIGAELGEVFAQLFDFFRLLRRQIQAGAAIIPHRFVEQLFVLAGKFRLRVGESL